MNIPINKNIDEYKDNFYKGLTMRQTMYAGATLVVGTLTFCLADFYFGLPQMPSIFITMAPTFFCAVMGFGKKYGMSIPEYLEKHEQIIRQPCYLYESEEAVYIAGELEKRKQKKRWTKRNPVYFDRIPQEEEGIEQ